jgi:hypothetical protein
MSWSPKPSKEHGVLTRLAAQWEGPVQLHASAWGPSRVTGARVKARVALDGFYAVMEYEQEQQGWTYQALGVFGYDRGLRAYTMHWFDNPGEVPREPAIGTWDGERLVFETSDADGRGRFTFHLPEPGRGSLFIERDFHGPKLKPYLHAAWPPAGARKPPRARSPRASSRSSSRS